MAMSARVTNANGRIVAEKRGGTRRYHQHDALGSTIALINDAGTVTNTYDYWPYGEIRTPVFGLPTPFLYCGQWGYYTDTTGRLYVRARTYRPVFTRWLTMDALWPEQQPYLYTYATPMSLSDVSGYEPCKDCRTGSSTGGFSGCGDKPKVGPCGSIGTAKCQLMCRIYGTDLIPGKAEEVVSASLCGLTLFRSCCCPCLCKCDSLSNGSTCPAVGLEACAKALMERKLFPVDPGSNYELGPPHPNNGAVATQCGFCSDGFHFQYRCKDRSGKIVKGGVTTAKCCRCRESGRDSYKCSIKPCHRGKAILP